ncbi:DUF4870 domain-containing protein [bacterium]|nr:DUF4870 domain-containing protein [bacterium]
MPTQEEKIWGALAHVSYLAGLPLIFPLILYIWQREHSPFVAAQAKQAVGLHLVTLILVALTVGVSFATFGLGLLVAVPALSLFGILAFIFSVLAAIQVAQGNSYHYPVFGRWVDSF